MIASLHQSAREREDQQRCKGTLPVSSPLLPTTERSVRSSARQAVTVGVGPPEQGHYVPPADGQASRESCVHFITAVMTGISSGEAGLPTATRTHEHASLPTRSASFLPPLAAQQ